MPTPMTAAKIDSNWRNEVLTVREAAMLLHVSTPTVYRMIRAGILIPSTELIRAKGHQQIAIPRAEIEHYITALKTSARRLQRRRANA